MKYIYLALSLLISTNIHALDLVNHHEVKINEFLSKIDIEQIRSIERENISNMFQKINKNKSYTEYKKELLKANIILFYQSIYMAENENDLLKIARNSFPVSVCTAYQFQNNTTNILNEMLTDILNTDFKINKYNDSAKFLYSDNLMKKLQAFLPKSLEEIQNNCIQGKTFPLI